jgi:uncharacterized protein YndB with AHSA1/START domain
VVRRILAATREDVFDALVDPASIVRWMRPGDVTHTTAEVDPRVGGAFRIVMSHGSGPGEHWGHYLAIDRPSLLQFTWISHNTDLLASEVTVELFERPAGTELVLTHRRLPPTKLAAHRKGWVEIVERLSVVLAENA